MNWDKDFDTDVLTMTGKENPENVIILKNVTDLDATLLTSAQLIALWSLYNWRQRRPVFTPRGEG